MSYSCTDGYSDITGALSLKTPKGWDADGADHVSDETDLALAEIARLQLCAEALAAAQGFVCWARDHGADKNAARGMLRLIKQALRKRA